jgi:hypothetical protein
VAGRKGVPMTDPDDKSQGIEYSIFAAEMPAPGQKGKVPLQRQGMRKEMRDALAAAEEMIATGQYQRVEVRQKYFDKKKNREIDMTVKVFEKRAKKEIGVFAILLFAVLCGGIAFGVTYFLLSR